MQECINCIGIYHFYVSVGLQLSNNSIEGRRARWNLIGLSLQIPNSSRPAAFSCLTSRRTLLVLPAFQQSILRSSFLVSVPTSCGSTTPHPTVERPSGVAHARRSPDIDILDCQPHPLSSPSPVRTSVRAGADPGCTGWGAGKFKTLADDEMLVQNIMPRDAMRIGLKNPVHQKLLFF